MSNAVPFAPGIGSKIFSPSVLSYYGVNVSSNAVVQLSSDQTKRRRIEFIGASDTAGFCVDGTPDTSVVATIEGWKYDNCANTSASYLGKWLNADLSMEAIPGIGLVQNANSNEQWEMGKLTMRDYWLRTLNSQNTTYDFQHAEPPDLVVISLGGNDYNHQ
eukprot:UN28573